MDATGQTIVSTVKKINSEMDYFGYSEQKLKSIMSLIIMNHVYRLSDWFMCTVIEKNKILTKINDLIRTDNSLVLLSSVSNEVYKNVNTLQTDFTWQRIYDNKNLNISFGYLIGDNGDYIPDDEGNYIIVN